MTDRITSFSVGRRWRCQRTNSVSFDFVIVGLGKGDSKRCRLEPLPGQERAFGVQKIADTAEVELVYSHAHLRRVAVLQPISLDDIARSI